MSTQSYAQNISRPECQLNQASQENVCPINANSKLPWGWHFRPTGAELIVNLNRKVQRQRQDRRGFEPVDISDVAESDVLREIDLSQVEPWEIKDIPETCSIRGTHADYLNQYFYTHKEQKYRHGKRSNRATRRGFWKATGRDKAIYGRLSKREKEKRVIGYRKALVFYEGRAPNGNKTDWILHEYRLEGDPDSTEEQWVACHMFIKERNIPPREILDISVLPDVAWPELGVKEDSEYLTTYSGLRFSAQHIPYHLPSCVSDDLSLPRLVDEDTYSMPREVTPASGVNVLPRSDVGIIAELLNCSETPLSTISAENLQQSIWPNLEGPRNSDSLWSVFMTPT